MTALHFLSLSLCGSTTRRWPTIDSNAIRTQALLFSIWGIIFFKIKVNKSGSKELTVTASELNPPNPMATMMGLPDPYADAPNQKMTFAEYDMKMLRAALGQQFMQFVIVCGVHYKWGSVMPLVMSVSMALLNIPSNALVRLHLFNEDPSKLSPEDRDEITRPFKPKTPFGNMMEEMKKKQKQEELAAKKEEQRKLKKALKKEK